jgi:4-hydroxy-4-methyl-2-oxoglutarate aldolase
MTDCVLTVRRSITRPSADVLRALQGVPTGWVVDAQGRRGALDPGIRRLVGNGVVCGPALTVWTAPRDNLAPYAALEFVQPGDILVIATGDYAGASVVGDLFAGMARNSRVAAVVTDGLARDIEGLRQVGMPLFARGLTPNSPLKQGPGEIGRRISLGGVTIEAGDIVVGDEDGVVVIPQAAAAHVLEALEAVRAKENDMEARIEAGLKQPPWLSQILTSGAVRFED